MITVRTTKMAFIDNVAKPPRNVQHQQARFGTANTMAQPRHKYGGTDMVAIGTNFIQLCEENFFQDNLVSNQTSWCDPSLESSRRDDSNEWSHHRVWSKNDKEF